jgi:predicted PhzF superfamily epimerase YddE/YHI9
MKYAYVGRVFCDEQGNHGNPVGIIEDCDAAYTDEERTRIAAKLGFSESVFINNYSNWSISIYTVTGEIGFAGHAAVGAASFFLQKNGNCPEYLTCRDGKVSVLEKESMLWVISKLCQAPPWCHEHVSDLKSLESLNGPLDECQGHTMLWSWIDESRGIVRARTFASAWGIPEDEANGSGCMQLAAVLGRQLKVHHGVGSILYASPDLPGRASVGGCTNWEDRLN